LVIQFSDIVLRCNVTPHSRDEKGQDSGPTIPSAPNALTVAAWAICRMCGGGDKATSMLLSDWTDALAFWVARVILGALIADPGEISVLVEAQ